MTVISLRDVFLTYRIRKQLFTKVKREVPVFKGLTFDLYQGEKLGVVGKNGCGKSTLFKLLSSIFSPDLGDIVFKKRLNVQLLSLGVGYDGNLTGKENAILGGMLIGKSRKFMFKVIDEIRQFSGLGKFFDFPIYTYSTGMIARLGFSVAMYCDPDVLLIDEVLGVGDASFGKKSYDAIKNRFSENQTIVLVSHSPEVIVELCTRAIWIDKGVVAAEGEPSKVIDKYLSNI